MKKMLLAFTLAVAFPGAVFAKAIGLEAQPSTGQRIHYTNGYASLVSQTAESGAITLYMNDAVFGRPTFFVVAQNTLTSKDSLNFGPQNIRVSINGRPVHILTNDELMRNLNDRAATANALSGLGDMGYRMNGDPLGRVKNELKRRDTQDRFTQMAESLNQQSLKMETLSSGQVTKGFIVLEKLRDAGSGQDLVIELDVGPDHHVLHYRTM